MNNTTKTSNERGRKMTKETKTFEAILSTTGRVAVSMFIEASTKKKVRCLVNDLTGNEPIAVRSLKDPEFVAEK